MWCKAVYIPPDDPESPARGTLVRSMIGLSVATIVLLGGCATIRALWMGEHPDGYSEPARILDDPMETFEHKRAAAHSLHTRARKAQSKISDAAHGDNPAGVDARFRLKALSVRGIQDLQEIAKTDGQPGEDAREILRVLFRQLKEPPK